MAGLTQTGFEIKRLPEVVTELKSDARTVFQDLVPPGDIVDTSDSSTIGRLIALHAPQYADIWELLGQIYAAFDPNSSTGIPLDNLVALNGTVREPSLPTVADVVSWGDTNTTTPVGVELRATNGDSYVVNDSIVFSQLDCIGFITELPSVVEGTEYVIEIIRAGTTILLTHTAGPGATPVSVLAALYTQIQANPLFISSVSATQLKIESDSIYVPVAVISNLPVVKVKVRSLARNILPGELPLEANTLTTISTPVLGWDSVTNPFLGITGDNEETDDELRARFAQNKYISAININESLYSALINIPDVQEVRVVENNTNAYDPVFELPGHSFKPIVLGGNASEIANAVWLNQPLGIASEGNTEIQVVDSQGYPQLVRFERPDAIRVYISLEIESTGSMPEDAPERIKDSLIEYFRVMNLGQDVIYSRLFTPINETPGFQVESLLIGTDPLALSASNISLDYREYATLARADIDVTVI